MTQTTTSAGIAQNSLLGEVYSKVLALFVSDSERIDWMSKPFKNNGKICSTNGWTLCVLPGDGMEAPVYDEKLKSVYPLEYNCFKRISLAELKEAINKAPLIDDFDEVEEDCGACYGEGEVEYEFSHGTKDYTMDYECPVCEGEGKVLGTSDVPNGKKVIDYSKKIVIGNSTFNITRLKEMVNVCELLGESDFTLVYQQKSTQGSLFKIGEAELLVKPCTAPAEEDVCANLA